MAQKKVYKFGINLSFNTRALITLEKRLGMKIGEAFLLLQNEDLTTIVEFVAAGANVTFDEAIDLIEVEEEKGMSGSDLIKNLFEEITKSSFLKDPAIQKALSEAKKKDAKENTEA